MGRGSLVPLSRLEDLLGRDRRELRALAEDVRAHYTPFHLHDTWGLKKNDRHIDNPAPHLKAVQRDVARCVFSAWQAPYGMFGAVAGRSLLHNAQMHSGRRVLVTIDIEKCFPSISNVAVYDAIHRLVGVTETAKLLTRLTTVGFHLPQGAPTSTVLANMVMQPAFDELRARAGRIGVAVSSWVDDFAFSGARAPELIGQAYEVFSRLGLRVARQKVHVFRSHREALRLTKLVLNRRPSLGRERINKIRSAILAAAHADVADWDLRRLRGQIAFARSISRQQGAALKRLADQKLPTHGRPAPPPRRRFAKVPCDCRFGRGMVERAA